MSLGRKQQMQDETTRETNTAGQETTIGFFSHGAHTNCVTISSFKIIREYMGKPTGF